MSASVLAQPMEKRTLPSGKLPRLRVRGGGAVKAAAGQDAVLTLEPPGGFGVVAASKPS